MLCTWNLQHSVICQLYSNWKYVDIDNVWNNPINIIKLVKMKTMQCLTTNHAILESRLKQVP